MSGKKSIDLTSEKYSTLLFVKKNIRYLVRTMYLYLKSNLSLSIITEDIPTNSMYLSNLVGILFSKH